ncbi:MAG: hypothetical protein CL933_09645 [Deltaproteobacteria bacterium]|nr:hypothetical protein [Deltaproteobacteria bacterium]
MLAVAERAGPRLVPDREISLSQVVDDDNETLGSTASTDPNPKLLVCDFGLPRLVTFRIRHAATETP